MKIALALLTVGALRHYLWPAFPAELQGMASKGLGGVAALGLILAVWHLSDKTKELGYVLLWWAWEESQVLLCSIAYMAKPWEVRPGLGICSARLDFDIGAIGIVIVGALAYHLSNLTVSKNRDNGQNE